MQYANPADAVVTGGTFIIDPRAVRIGVVGATVYTARNEVAMNPFKPDTAAWLSFNLGARKYLESLPNDVKLAHQFGADPSEGFYRRTTTDRTHEWDDIKSQFFKFYRK